MILIIDTTQKEAVLAVKDGDLVKDVKWEAGRELSATFFLKLKEIIPDEKMHDLKGIVVNSGPGSYTGLRIGLSIANTMAYSLHIPIVGVKEVNSFDSLILEGEKKLANEKNFTQPVMPFYGSEPNITQPKNSH